MRKRAIKLISVLFITSSLLVALFPFYIVKADSQTYWVVPDNRTDGTIGSCYLYQTSGTGEARAVIFSNSSYTNIFVVSKVNNLQFKFYASGNVRNVTSYNRVYRVDGVPYYFYCDTTPNSSSLATSGVNAGFPVVSISTHTDSDVVSYTWGANAVGPSPVINYGDLIIEGYSTDIAGSGSAAIQNIDHIKWNSDFDSNGNDISNMKVRLKIVPGNYIASRASDLLLQRYDDFIENQFNSDETVYNASDGEAIISWEYVVDKFDNIINRIYLFNMGLNADTWEKQGWLYKLRLEDESNNYIGDWQTVYSSTSSGVQNDLNIINNNSINQEFITTLQEINNINNVENNWTVNNTEISVENNYTAPTQGEKPWWAYLLESILNTFNITNNYIYEGDSNTQNITNTVNDSDDNMNRKIGEYQQFEDSFIDDMDDNLTDIDTDIDFLSDNKFIASANWVAQQYNRMTNNTVIGSFIGFSLMFGLALIFIGKIR